MALVVTGALSSIFPERSPSFLESHVTSHVHSRASASGFSPVGPVTFPRLHHELSFIYEASLCSSHTHGVHLLTV